MPSFVDHLIKLGVDPLIQLVVVVGAAILLAAWWLWWRLPKRQVDRLSLKIRDAKARADVEDSFRKTIGQLLGGVAVLVGASFAYLQFSQQQTQFSAQQQQFSQQQQASHELLISNQVAKGFEQLGSHEVIVQLGGIYALEGVMNTSEQYHRPVLEALCAFVRDNTRSEVKDDQSPATEIQAALTVIGRRHSHGTALVDLPNVHLPNVELITADLSDADLSGATLSYANLIGANLSGADLSDANLSGANLIDANLSDADLSDANLSGAYLTGADLSDADLSRATLTLNNAVRTVAGLMRATISQAQLDSACGDGAKLPPGLTLKPCASPNPPPDVTPPSAGPGTAPRTNR
jgi:uncharacterized protein YjbI with pentapeptide repeats